jgi:hypothetical protein
MSSIVNKLVNTLVNKAVKDARNGVIKVSKDVVLKSRLSIKAEKNASRLLEKSEMKKMSNEDTKPLKTEDLGIIFEKAICMKKDIPFIGSFKYSSSKAKDLAGKLEKWNYPHSLVHTAEGQGQYDFTGGENESIKLSAKTNKRGGKVSPQILGQPTKNTFCKHFQLCETISLVDIKKYILENVASMLDKYYKFTFDADILYYNEHKNKILFIKHKDDIPWKNYDICFTKDSIDSGSDKYWNESSSISINKKNIGEFQIHNNRNCIKFRWNFENLLTLFDKYFDIKLVYPPLTQPIL